MGLNMRFLGVVLMMVLLCSSCTSINQSNNNGLLQSYAVPVIEASWIRNGEPIVYEGQQWIPVRDTENLLDTEVYQVGEYKNVQIFVDKSDVKPYERIYTKFAKGKFRYFVRPKND